MIDSKSATTITRGEKPITDHIGLEKALLTCVNAILEKKGRDIVVMSVRGISSFTDYFIICTGTSVRHTQSLSAIVQEAMKKAGYAPRGVEGETVGTWILLDYYDLIVHVFYEPMRQFYALENLWADAPINRIDENAASINTLTG